MTEYAVIYEQGNDGWGAYSPDLPGEVSQGDTSRCVSGATLARQPFASTEQWTLSAGAGYKGVSAQVRDAAHNESNSIYTRISCTAPCS